MVDNTFIRSLVSSGYAGIKIDKEGNFQLDLTSVRQGLNLCPKMIFLPLGTVKISSYF